MRGYSFSRSWLTNFIEKPRYSVDWSAYRADFHTDFNGLIWHVIQIGRGELVPFEKAIKDGTIRIVKPEPANESIVQFAFFTDRHSNMI